MIQSRVISLQRLALSPNIELLFFQDKVIGLKICDSSWTSYFDVSAVYRLEGWEEATVTEQSEIEKMTDHLEELIDVVALQF